MNNRIDNIIKRQKEFQRAVGFPIDSISEIDRNDMSERYIFKLIEEAVELRKEFPSSINPWSKKQKSADLQRVKEEFSDVVLFLINIAIVWKFSPEQILEILENVQQNNINVLKEKKMEILNTDILKVPNHVSGIGSWSLSPKYIFIGQNPGESIPHHGYQCWSEPKFSGKIILPALEEMGILKKSYLTNIVKSSTSKNVTPEDDQVDFWWEFLQKELEILSIGSETPPIIIALGEWADSVLTKKEIPHLTIRHPSYYLRNGWNSEKYKIEELIPNSIT